MKRSKGEPPKNVPASIKGRLLALARSQDEDFNAILTRYVLERLLHRLAASIHATGFVLKGATLFVVWSGKPHRATRDVDLLGFGTPDLGRLAMVFREICEAAVEDDDGLRFDGDSIHAAPIRADAVYDGVRVTFLAFLGSARVPVQVDVGFGDAALPSPVLVELPTLLAHPRPTLRAYRREVAIAEKLHAMVDLGVANSRMKDYFDVWFLSRHFEIDGADLALAIQSTFERRETPIPSGVPVGLRSEFSESVAKLAQWKAFVRRTRLAVEAPSFPEAVAAVGALALPVLHELAEARPFTGTWNASGTTRWVREEA